MTLLRTWLTKLTMADSPDFSDAEIRQRLYFFISANIVGVSVLLGFVVASTLKGEFLITDLILAALFVFSYMYLRATKQLLPASVIASLALMVFLLLHLVTGGNDNSGPLWCFVFPPAVIYLLGIRLGLVFSLIAVSPMMLFLIMRFSGLEVSGYTTTFIIRFLLAYFVETLLFYLVQSQKVKAQKDVKLLSGLLPLCSYCKKVRDDKGYWKQIDGYIQKHSDVDVSHSICPECAEKYYPDLDLYDD